MTAMLLAAFLLTAAPVPKDGTLSTDDWPQWRGTLRDGRSGVKGVHFPKSGPTVVWTNENVGAGYGQPSIVGDRVYVIGAEGGKAGNPEHLLALDIATGKEIWKLELGTSAGRYLDQWGGGPRSTPTFHDGRLYVLGATGDLLCATADGKKVWSKNLVKDFGGQIPQWGYSESPLIDDSHCVVTPGSGTGMIALDAKTGATVWSCKEFKDGAGYSSIVTMMVGETKLYIQQTMSSAVGVVAKTGKLAFKTGEIGRRTAVIPTPVVSGDLAFYTAGYGAGCECYRIVRDGDGFKAEKLYTNVKSLQDHHGGVIADGDFVYGHSDSTGWVCFPFKSKDPEPVWTSKKLGKGSIAWADGMFICYAEKNGEVAVIKATNDDWHEISRFTIPKTSPTRPRQGLVWPHPVVAQGKLFLRDYEYLFAYDVKAK